MSFTALAKATITGSTTSVSFNSIPQTYTDLLVYIVGRQGNAANYNDVEITFNSSTSNRTQRYVICQQSNNFATGTQVYFQVGLIAGSLAGANVYNTTQIYIPNYTSANPKSFLAINGMPNTAAAGGANDWYTNKWNDNTAISSIQVNSLAGNYATYSTFYLYGIKSA